MTDLFDKFQPMIDMRAGLLATGVTDPFGLVMEWMRLAAGAGDVAKKVQPNPNAMTLGTVDARGVPSVRVVLARGVDAARGIVTFYTNYKSEKGRAIGAEPSSTAPW